MASNEIFFFVSLLVKQLRICLLGKYYTVNVFIKLIIIKNLFDLIRILANENNSYCPIWGNKQRVYNNHSKGAN